MYETCSTQYHQKRTNYSENNTLTTKSKRLVNLILIFKSVPHFFHPG